jgi:GDP-4-dehydro-6-deoxy-D-mannose reductase
LRVLITGGTGFVGSHLVGLLKRESCQISVLASTQAASRETGIDYHCVNIRDAQGVQAVLQQLSPDQIYHLAGVSTVDAARRQPSQAYETNVIGTHNLFDAAMSGPRPPRILNVSTAQVYAPSSRKLAEINPLGPDNPYAASKAMAEMLVYQYRGRERGGIITARSFNHTGPGQSPAYVLPAMAKQFAEIESGLRPPRLGLGNLDVKRDFTDVRDVVRAYYMLLMHGRAGEIYNVCSGIAVALSDIVGMFRAICDIEVAIDVEPSRVRSKDAAEVSGDPAKIHADTGWRPEIPLEQTIRDLLDYWRSRCPSQGTAVSP